MAHANTLVGAAERAGASSGGARDGGGNGNGNDAVGSASDVISDGAISEWPCVSEDSNLRLHQLMPGAAIGPSATVELGCDEIGLTLPKLRLCDPTDELALLWTTPTTEVWKPLLEAIPSGQRLALLDGLSPRAAYQFRLRLTRRSRSALDATDPIILGPVSIIAPPSPPSPPSHPRPIPILRMRDRPLA